MFCYYYENSFDFADPLEGFPGPHSENHCSEPPSHHCPVCLCQDLPWNFRLEGLHLLSVVLTLTLFLETDELEDPEFVLGSVPGEAENKADPGSSW